MKKNLLILVAFIVLFSIAVRGDEGTGVDVYITCNGYDVDCSGNSSCCSGFCSGGRCRCLVDGDCPRGTCFNSLCIWCGDGTCNGDEGCESCPADCGSCPGPGGGGGGGGAGGRRPSMGGAIIPTFEKPKADFEVSPSTIKLSMKPGESEKEYINIRNTGDQDLNIEIDLKNLGDFVTFPGGTSSYDLNIKPGKEKTVQLLFDVEEDQQPGVYPGKVILKAEGIEEEKTVTTTVEVESEEPLFDVSILVMPSYKTVFPEDSVYGRIDIYNMHPMGRFDAQLDYGMKDFDGNTLFEETEVFAIETRVSFVRSLLVPRNVKPGKYVFYAKASYNGTVGVSSDTFEVVKKEGIRIFGMILSPAWIIGLIVAAVLMMFSVLLILSLRRIYPAELKPRVLEERLTRVGYERRRSGGVMRRFVRSAHRRASSTTRELEKELRSLERAFRK